MAKRCAFAEPVEASATTAAVAAVAVLPPAEAASMALSPDRQWWAVAMSRGPADTELSRRDRKMMAPQHSPKVIRRRDRNSAHHQNKCGYIGDNASWQPLGSSFSSGQSIRDAGLAQDVLISSRGWTREVRGKKGLVLISSFACFTPCALWCARS